MQPSRKSILPSRRLGRSRTSLISAALDTPAGRLLYRLQERWLSRLRDPGLAARDHRVPVEPAPRHRQFARPHLPARGRGRSSHEVSDGSGSRARRCRIVANAPHPIASPSARIKFDNGGDDPSHSRNIAGDQPCRKSQSGYPGLELAAKGGAGILPVVAHPFGGAS